MAHCKFYAKGFCARGQTCSFEHVDDRAETSLGMRVQAKEFVPGGLLSSVPNSVILEQTICSFFQRGYCRNGDNCRFKHISRNSAVPKTYATPDPVTQISSALTSTSLDSNELSQLLGGATVRFENGATIGSVTLPSDFSTVEIAGLSLDERGIAVVTSFLRAAGLQDIDPFCINIKEQTNSVRQRVAHVTVQDPHFAQTCCRQAIKPSTIQEYPCVTVKELQASISLEASQNRIQNSAVICSWYNPSMVVYLYYDLAANARQAVSILNRSGPIHGRKIQAMLRDKPPRGSYTKFGRGTPCSVHLGNLHTSTKRGEFLCLLQDCKPTEVVNGPKSYSCSFEETETIIKSLLNRVSPIESWESIPSANNSRAKAIARFKTGEEALKVARTCHGDKIWQLGNSQLFVNYVVSVKFTVLTALYTSITSELDELKARSEDMSHVDIKSYPGSAAGVTTQLRVSGENVKAVARVKASVERVLAGTVAMHNGKSLWHTFFRQPRGFDCLKNIMATTNAFIYRDIRKSCLRLYGSPEVKLHAHRLLETKLLELIQESHQLVLDQATLRLALQGGFRAIVSKFGKDHVKMGISGKIKTISFSGSDIDWQEAVNILHTPTRYPAATTAGEDNADNVCAVCWTEPEDPFKTPCDHYYCRDCFISQCSTAGDGDGSFPIECLGDSGACGRVFTMKELENILSDAEFSTLQKASFALYVRSHPNDFQYCPTADCNQIYRRCNDTSKPFFCNACLTSVCRACQASNHEGFTCDEYRSFGSEEERSFASWKRKNDVRDCPKCATPIEKNEGCNHMECRACNAHICWFCMEVFKTSKECYDHMSPAHGGFFVRDV